MLAFMHTIVCIILLWTVKYETIEGHSKGAPPFSCQTMTPGHGVGAQTSPAPYNITVVHSSHPQLGRGVMRIRLHTLNNNIYFSGFLLRDKLVPSSASTPADASAPLTGKFVAVPSDSALLNCGNSKASGVTHSSNTKRKSVDVDWQAPNGFEGTVVFMATFVYNYSTFWVGIESQPVSASGSREPRAEFSNSDQRVNSLNQVTLSMYEGCGTTKSCLSFPDDCIETRTCNGLISIHPESFLSYGIEMFAKNSKYVAVGFSEDAFMGGDNVFECVQEGNTVKTYQSWNEVNRKTNRRLEDSSRTKLVNGIFNDGAIYCKISVQAVTFALDRKFDLNNEAFYMVFAAGSELAEDRLGVGYHDIFYTKSRSRRLLKDVIPETPIDPFYRNCGVTKTCFGTPDGCIDRQNCLAVTSIAVQGQRFVISMQARGAAYVATGLSEDLHMGDDHVIECVLNNSEIQAYESWNVPNRKDNIRIGTSGLQMLESRVDGDKLYCQVSYDPSKTQGFKFDEKYFILLAAGSSPGVEKIEFHNLVSKASAKQVSIPSSSKSDAFYRGCDRFKSCFGLPSGCIARQSCSTGVAMSSEFPGRYIFHMIAEDSPAYVAVALSDDPSMGNDVVFECVREDTNGNVIRPYMSWNIAGDKANKRLRLNYLQLENSSYVDGKLQCAVRLDNPVFNVEGKNFNLNTDKYYLLLAAGSSAIAGPNGKVEYHNLVSQPSAERRSLADVSAIRGASKLLLHLHGAFMVVSWIGLASLGIVLARYYKQTWVSSSCCGKDLWFFWHRFFMFLVWLLTIAGVIVIYLYIGGIVEGPGETHALVGIITAVLAFIQPLGAAFRPSPDSSRRPIFNWLHWLAGNAAHIGAIVTIFLAVDLKKAELPKWTDWILVAFVAYYVLVHLILSISGCFSDKSSGIRVNSMQMKDMNGGRNNLPHQPYERPKDASYSGTRKFIFTLHFFVVIAFTSLLTLLIIYAPVT